MVNFTTSKEKGTIYNTNLKYGNSRRSRTIRECKEEIDVYVIDVISYADKNELREVLDAACAEIKDMLNNTIKVGLTLNTGNQSLRVIIYQGDDLEQTKNSIIKKISTKAAVSNVINRHIRNKINKETM
jgi:hypothetical protein